MLRSLLFVSAFAVALLAGAAELSAQEEPQVLEKYRKHFVHFSDSRGFGERTINTLGLSFQDIGRGFALIAGASEYPRLSGETTLPPAAVDRDRLVAFLTKYEFFDEVVVLWNEEVTIENFEYFLQTYFPQRLERAPKSRFLFAYSGHGFAKHDLTTSYLLKSSARNRSDRSNAINLRTLKTYIDEVGSAAYHSVVLINSCYGGAFLKRRFGGDYIPIHPGSHAITAGSAQQQTWHDPAVGRGSIFFEKMLSGIEGPGPADASGGGIITVYELFTYLRDEVKALTNQAQVPMLGDLSVQGSEGGFFFLDRRRPLDLTVPGEWHVADQETMGPAAVRQGGLSIEIMKTILFQLESDSDLSEMHFYFRLANNTDAPLSVASLDLFLLTPEKAWEADTNLMAMSGERPLPIRLDVAEVAEFGWRVFFWDDEKSEVVTWEVATSKPTLFVKIVDNLGRIYRIEDHEFGPEIWGTEAVEALRELQRARDGG